MKGLGGLLGSVAGALIPIPGVNAAAATMLGGALGGMIDGDQQTNGGAGVQSSSRDPWAAAQPYMKQGMADTAQMQKFYQKTPFNPLQIQQYSNQFNDFANFRENVMPGLMNFANQGMSQGYQRGGSTLAPSQRGGGQPVFSMRPTQGLLDLNGPQYNPGAEIARKNEIRDNAPKTYQVGQSNDPVWEQLLNEFNTKHQQRFGSLMNRPWDSDADSQATYQMLLNDYLQRKG